MGNGIEVSKQKGPPYLLHLLHHLAPGDVLVMTAAVESLHRLYPGQYLTSVYTTCMPIWENNPHIVKQHPDSAVVEMRYPDINRSHEMPIGHFMGAFCSYLGQQIGKPLRCQVNKPSIYLSDQERTTKPVETSRPYMVVNAGIKSDFTNKAWGTANYQAVVDHFKDRIDFVQIGERNPSHFHTPLTGVIDMIGKTTPRQLFQLVHHGIGGLGPTTFVQHAHAALDRFYCCILGGREPKWWTDYPRQQTFSTMGQLPCCEEKACWKSRCVPLGDGDSKDRSLCSLPVILSKKETIPACMAAVKPQAVIQAIETYLSHRGS